MTATFGVVVTIGTSSCISRHTYGVTDAVYASGNSRLFSSEPVSTSLGGAKLGYEVRRVGAPLAGRFDAGYLQADSDWFRVLSLGAGAKYSIVTRGRLDAGGLGFVEYQNARLERYRNANHLIAFGVGAYVDLRVASTVALTLNLSAHAFADGTAPTTCRDGSTSQSVGQGTCSHHDGIAYYNDKLGPGTGLDALVGISVWFDAKSL